MNKGENIRHQIFELTEQYYNIVHKTKICPCTEIPYAGRVLTKTKLLMELIVCYNIGSPQALLLMSLKIK